METHEISPYLKNEIAQTSTEELEFIIKSADKDSLIKPGSKDHAVDKDTEMKAWADEYAKRTALSWNLPGYSAARMID